jgi:hypothetical protein
VLKRGRMRADQPRRARVRALRVIGCIRAGLIDADQSASETGKSRCHRAWGVRAVRPQRVTTTATLMCLGSAWFGHDQAPTESADLMTFVRF